MSREQVLSALGLGQPVGDSLEEVPTPIQQQSLSSELQQKGLKNLGLPEENKPSLSTELQRLGHANLLQSTLPKKTFGTAFEEVLAKPHSIIPYVNAIEMKDSFRILDLSMKAREGTATEDEMMVLNGFLEERRRDSTFGYKVVNMALHLPAFAIEFMTAGGLIKGGAKQVLKHGAAREAKKAAAALSGTASDVIGAKVEKEALEVAGDNFIEEIGAEFVFKASDIIGKPLGTSKASQKLAQLLADDTAGPLLQHTAYNIPRRFGVKTQKAATDAFARIGGKPLTSDRAKKALDKRTRELMGRNFRQSIVDAPLRGLLMSHRVPNQVAERMTPQLALNENEMGVLEAELLREGDGFMEALFKSFGDQTIEAFSERTGESFVVMKSLLGGKAMSSFMKAGLIKDWATSVGSKLFPNDTARDRYLKSAREVLERHFFGVGKKVTPTSKFIQKTGFNGVINEILEERVGDLLRVGFDLQDASSLAPKELLDRVAVEAVAFMFNPMAIGGMAVDGLTQNLDTTVKEFKTTFEPFKAEEFGNMMTDEQYQKAVGFLKDYMEQRAEKPSTFIEKVQHHIIKTSRKRVIDDMLTEMYGYQMDYLTGVSDQLTDEDLLLAVQGMTNTLRVRDEAGRKLAQTAGVEKQNPRILRSREIWTAPVRAWAEDEFVDIALLNPGLYAIGDIKDRSFIPTNIELTTDVLSIPFKDIKEDKVLLDKYANMFKKYDAKGLPDVERLQRVYERLQGVIKEAPVFTDENGDVKKQYKFRIAPLLIYVNTKEEFQAAKQDLPEGIKPWNKEDGTFAISQEAASIVRRGENPTIYMGYNVNLDGLAEDSIETLLKDKGLISEGSFVMDWAEKVYNDAQIKLNSMKEDEAPDELKRLVSLLTPRDEGDRIGRVSARGALEVFSKSFKLQRLGFVAHEFDRFLNHEELTDLVALPDNVDGELNSATDASTFIDALKEPNAPFDSIAVREQVAVPDQPDADSIVKTGLDAIDISDIMVVASDARTFGEFKQRFTALEPFFDLLPGRLTKRKQSQVDAGVKRLKNLKRPTVGQFEAMFEAMDLLEEDLLTDIPEEQREQARVELGLIEGESDAETKEIVQTTRDKLSKRQKDALAKQESDEAIEASSGKFKDQLQRDADKKKIESALNKNIVTHIAFPPESGLTKEEIDDAIKLLRTSEPTGFESGVFNIEGTVHYFAHRMPRTKNIQEEFDVFRRAFAPLSDGRLSDGESVRLFFRKWIEEGFKPGSKEDRAMKKLLGNTSVTDQLIKDVPSLSVLTEQEPFDVDQPPAEQVDVTGEPGLDLDAKAPKGVIKPKDESTDVRDGGVSNSNAILDLEQEAIGAAQANGEVSNFSDGAFIINQRKKYRDLYKAAGGGEVGERLIYDLSQDPESDFSKAVLSEEAYKAYIESTDNPEQQLFKDGLQKFGYRRGDAISLHNFYRDLILIPVFKAQVKVDGELHFIHGNVADRSFQYSRSIIDTVSKKTELDDKGNVELMQDWVSFKNGDLTFEQFLNRTTGIPQNVFESVQAEAPAVMREIERSFDIRLSRFMRADNKSIAAQNLRREVISEIFIDVREDARAAGAVPNLVKILNLSQDPEAVSLNYVNVNGQNKTSYEALSHLHRVLRANGRKLRRIDGIFSNDFNLSAKEGEMTEDDMLLIMRTLFEQTKDTGKYWQPIGQFGDKDQFYIVEVDRVAGDFDTNFIVNTEILRNIIHGGKDNYKDLVDMVKRAGSVNSGGTAMNTDISIEDGGIGKIQNHVVLNDATLDAIVDGKKLSPEVYDGFALFTGEFAKRAMVAMGSVTSKEEVYPDLAQIKAIYSDIETNKPRDLTKVNYGNLDLIKHLPGYEAIANWVEKQNEGKDYKDQIHTISFSSGTKLPSVKSDVGKARTINLFGKKKDGSFFIKANVKVGNKMQKRRNDKFLIQLDLRQPTLAEESAIPKQEQFNLIHLPSADMNVNFFNEIIAQKIRENTTPEALNIENMVDADNDLGLGRVVNNNESQDDPRYASIVQKIISSQLSKNAIRRQGNRNQLVELPVASNHLLPYEEIDGKMAMPWAYANIEGIRYAEGGFKSKREAMEFIWLNKGKFIDMFDTNDQGEPIISEEHILAHEIRKQGRTWTIPGELIISTRVPADNYHSTNLLRAFESIPGAGNVIMTDIQSQLIAGADNDGDTRFVTTVYKNDKNNQITGSGSQQAIYNKSVRLIYKDYQNPDFSARILKAIDTEAYDDIVKKRLKEQAKTSTIKEFSKEEYMDSMKKNIVGKRTLAIIAALNGTFDFMKKHEIMTKEGIFSDIEGESANGSVLHINKHIAIDRRNRVNEDAEGLIKAHIGNLLNLAADNAKDPKLEILGFNEVTIPMVITMLMSNPNLTSEESIVKYIEHISDFMTSPMMSSYVAKKRAEKNIAPNKDAVTDITGSADDLKMIKALEQLSSDIGDIRLITSLMFDLPSNVVEMLEAERIIEKIDNNDFAMLDVKGLIDSPYMLSARRSVDTAKSYVFNRDAMVSPSGRKIYELSVEGNKGRQLSRKRTEILSRLSRKAVMVNALFPKNADGSYQAVDYGILRNKINERRADYLAQSANQFLLSIFDNGTEIQISPVFRFSELPEDFVNVVRADFDALDDAFKADLALYSAAMHGLSSSSFAGSYAKLIGDGHSKEMNVRILNELDNWTSGKVKQSTIDQVANEFKSLGETKYNPSPMVEETVPDNESRKKKLRNELSKRRKQDTKFDWQKAETYNGIRIIRTNDPKISARYNRKDNTITVNNGSIAKKFREKAWQVETESRLPGVTSLLIDFPKLSDWARFVFEHEYQHSLSARRENESKADYENRINEAALDVLGYNLDSNSLAEFNTKVLPHMERAVAGNKTGIGFFDPNRDVFEKIIQKYSDMFAEDPELAIERFQADPNISPSFEKERTVARMRGIHLTTNGEIFQLKQNDAIDGDFRKDNGQLNFSFSLMTLEDSLLESGTLLAKGANDMHRILLDTLRDARSNYHDARMFVDSVKRRLGLIDRVKDEETGKKIRFTPEEKMAIEAILEATGAVLDGNVNKDGEFVVVTGVTKIPKEDRIPGSRVSHIPKTKTVSSIMAQFNRMTDLQDKISRSNLDARDFDPFILALGKTKEGKKIKGKVDISIRNKLQRELEVENRFVESIGIEEWMGYLEDYIKHRYESANKDDKRNMNLFIEEARSSKSRKFDTYFDAAKFGLRPITMNALTLYEMRAREVWQVAANKVIINMFASIRNGSNIPVMLPEFNLSHDGTDMVMTPQTLRYLANNILSSVNELTGEKESIDASKDIRLEINRLGQKLRTAIESADASRRSEYKQVKVPTVNGSVISYHVLDGTPVKFTKMVVEKLPEEGWLKKVELLNSMSKYAGLAISVFHPFALLESMVSTSGLVNNLIFDPKGTWVTIQDIRKKIASDPEYSRPWVRAGMGVDLTSPDIQMQSLDEMIRKQVVRLQDRAEKSGDGLQKAFWRRTAKNLNGLFRVKRAWDDFLWREMHPVIKLYSAESVFKRRYESAIAKGEKVDAHKLRVEISQYINNAFGGQEWERYTWATPQAKRMLHLLMFAPDWTISAFNVAGGGNVPFVNKILKNRPTATENNEAVKNYWPAMAGIVLFGIPNAIQFSIYLATRGFDGGDDDEPFMFLNEEGKQGHIDLTPLLRQFDWLPIIGYEGGESEQRRVYMQFGKQAYEVIDWYLDPPERLLTKSSSVVRTAIEQATGSTASGWELPFKDQGLSGALSVDGSFMDSRAGYIVQKFIPFSFLGPLQGQPTGFIAPTSRGMSRGKATTLVTEALTVYASTAQMDKVQKDPDLEFNLAAVIPSVLDASMRNGYDVNEIMKRASSHARSDLYWKFFNAINKNNTSKMEEIAEDIVALNGVISSVEKSMDKRFSNVNREMTDTQREAFTEALRKAGAR